MDGSWLCRLFVAILVEALLDVLLVSLVVSALDALGYITTDNINALELDSDTLAFTSNTPSCVCLLACACLLSGILTILGCHADAAARCCRICRACSSNWSDHRLPQNPNLCVNRFLDTSRQTELEAVLPLCERVFLHNCSRPSMAESACNKPLKVSPLTASSVADGLRQSCFAL